MTTTENFLNSISEQDQKDYVDSQYIISIFEDNEYSSPILNKAWRYKDLPRIGDKVAYETDNGTVVATVADVYWFLGDEQDWMTWYSFSARIFAVQTKTNL